MEETRKPARKQRAADAPRPAAKRASASGKTSVRKPAVPVRAAVARPSAAEREEMVRTAAYYRAERRGFAPGREWEDWLAAEAEVTELAAPRPAPKSRKVPSRKVPSRKPRAG